MEKRFEDFLKHVETAVREKQIPGAVVAIGRGGELYALKAYGNAIITPIVEPMTEDTLFDVASLSKLVGVWSGIVQYRANGKLPLDATLP